MPIELRLMRLLSASYPARVAAEEGEEDSDGPSADMVEQCLSIDAVFVAYKVMHVCVSGRV